MGSERGFCFGPNLGSVDFLDLFRKGDDWADLRRRLAAFKVYGDNVRADYPDYYACGPNTYPAMCDAAAFETLRAWQLPLHLETGAVKDWDPEGVVLTADALALIGRVRRAGGDVDIVSMDEPLASTIRGAFARAPKQLSVEHAGDVARFAANWARSVSEAGPRVGLIEAYPYHPASLIAAFVRNIVDDNGVPLAFVELDIDVNGIDDQRISPERVARDLADLRQMCADAGLAFRLIVTALRAKTADAYRQDALDAVRRIRNVAPPFDGATIQSWREVPSASDRQLPDNLPADAATSHLGVLRAVISSNLLE